MSRQDRRLRRKQALRVLSGGRKEDDAPKADPNQPAARLAMKLDKFLQTEMAAEGLDGPQVLAVLLQLSAAIVAELGEQAPTDEVLRALDVFIDREREARGETDPPPKGPQGA